METKDKSGQFVNDLLRTEFHKSVSRPRLKLQPKSGLTGALYL